MIGAAGNAKKLIGKLVIEWAEKSPSDPRVPEALFVAAMANQSYKYGCSGWEHDADLQAEAEDLLLERYSDSPWTAKLLESRQ